ncbi:MAG: CDP-diacylglycerol--glycerol-3-phosphate 3-phosphatidyltransferase [Methylacidiphilales bacterium]|nr:CDP-diacylglycerol--glycerol-3-phosphate 3-phosphatidyltransferase [Candidatus Methylacidiphilales bacterium]
MTFSNIITLLRIIVTPVIVFFILYFNYSKNYTYLNFAILLLILAAISDWLDGYIARVYNQVTSLGKMLDPLADKIIIQLTLITIIVLYNTDLFIITCIILIHLREIIILGLRERMGQLGVSSIVQVSLSGKFKTTLLFLSIILLLLNYQFSDHFYTLGKYFLLLSLVLSLYSMFIYIFKSIPFLK